MKRGYFILKNRQPVITEDISVWGKFMENTERIVDNTEIGDVVVSTVFLGLDHQYGVGEPLLFETMIFGGVHDQYQERYSTWDEAVKGHAFACEMVSLKD